MHRYRSLLPVTLALMLAACGGGDNGSTAPVDNGTTSESDLPIDTPVYDGDTPTAIDAAAKNPTAVPLAPDSPIGENAIAAETEEAPVNRQD